MDDTKITVTTPDNKTFQVEVLDIFNVVGYEGKDYILYTLGEEIDEDHEQAYVSILEEDNNNFNLTEIMLNHYIRKVNGKSFLSRPRILICCPSNITQVEKNAIKEKKEII